MFILYSGLKVTMINQKCMPKNRFGKALEECRCWTASGFNQLWLVLCLKRKTFLLHVTYLSWQEAWQWKIVSLAYVKFLIDRRTASLLIEKIELYSSTERKLSKHAKGGDGAEHRKLGVMRNNKKQCKKVLTEPGWASRLRYRVQINTGSLAQRTKRELNFPNVWR